MACNGTFVHPPMFHAYLRNYHNAYLKDLQKGTISAYRSKTKNDQLAQSFFDLSAGKRNALMSGQDVQGEEVQGEKELGEAALKAARTSETTSMSQE